MTRLRHPFFLCIYAIAFLYLSWITPGFSAIWQALDAQIFHFFNTYFLASSTWQIFWGVANLRSTDVLGEACMLFLILVYIGEGSAEDRPRRTAHLFYIILWMLIAQFLSKCLLIRIMETFDLIGRNSPSISFEHVTRLSNFGFFHFFKDVSTQSFPGDHAITLFVWGAFLLSYWGKKRWGWIVTVAILFSLPRVVSGAHWFTDVVIGSGSVTLLCLAIGVFSPMEPFVVSLLERLFRGKRKKAAIDIA